MDDLWFYYFDRDHDEADPNKVDHILLRDAIRHMKGVHKFPLPCFVTVNNQYKRLSVEKRSAVFFEATTQEKVEEIVTLKGEHQQRLSEVRQWSQQRLDSAKRTVSLVLPDMNKHARENFVVWPPIYVGLLHAADKTTNGELIDEDKYGSHDEPLQDDEGGGRNEGEEGEAQAGGAGE